MRVVIHGSYGTGNRGDDVILSQLLQLLAAELPGAEITLLCRDEQRVSLYLRSEHHDLALRVTPLHASFRRHPWAVLRACLRADLFILGGGGLLWGTAPGNLSYWLQRARLARLNGARLAFYLPGIYGVRGDRARRLLGRVARSAAFLSVRDEEGFEQLRHCGVPEASILLGADPAFLLPPPEPAQIDNLRQALGLEHRRLVGLSARDWQERLSAGIFAKFVRQLLADPDLVLLFFAMKTGGRLGETDTDDITVARHLMLTLPSGFQQRMLIVDDAYSDAEMIALLGACDYLVAMRLHALIFATIAGTPCGALAYDDKVRAYMSMVGREEHLLDLAEATDPERLRAMTAALAIERAQSVGPAPQLMMAAASLAARARNVHQAFAGELRRWRSEASSSPPEVER